MRNVCRGVEEILKGLHVQPLLKVYQGYPLLKGFNDYTAVV